MGQVRDDCLAAIARVAPDQIVEHAALGAEIVEGAGLVHVEMRGPVGQTHAQYATRFRVGFGGFQLKFGTVELVRDVSGQGIGPAHGIHTRGGRSAAPHELASRPPRTVTASIGHDVPPLRIFFSGGTLFAAAAGVTVEWLGLYALSSQTVSCRTVS